MKLKTETYDGHTTRSFICPGCKDWHSFNDGWQFNGDVDKPTFSPSLLVTCGHYVSSHKDGDRCWCTWNAENPDDPTPFHCYRCHSFVRDGRIEFLSDCSHSLAGQTIDLAEIAP